MGYQTDWANDALDTYGPLNEARSHLRWVKRKLANGNVSTNRLAQLQRMRDDLIRIIDTKDIEMAIDDIERFISREG